MSLSKIICFLLTLNALFSAEVSLTKLNYYSFSKDVRYVPTLEYKGVKYTETIETGSQTKGTILLDGQAESFSAIVALRGRKPGGSVEYIISVDGQEKWRSGVLKRGMDAKEATVDLKGAKTLELEVHDAGDGTHRDYGVWLKNVITYNGKKPEFKPQPYKPIKPEDIHKAQLKDVLPAMTKLEGTVPAQWRISWTDDPATEATISWTTAEEGSKHTVYYGTEATKGNLNAYSNKIEAYKNGQYQGNEGHIGHGEVSKDQWSYFHHVKLKDLKPNTRYYFTIVSDKEKSREFYFITAPRESEEYYLLNGGDSRSGHTERIRMNLRMTQMMVEEPRILALAHGGDYCNQGSRWSDWRGWLSHNELLTAADGRVLPIIPARGNHEANDLYGQVFDAKFYHVTKLPLDLNIITLDSNGTRGITAKTKEEGWWSEETQGEWFKKTIEEVAPKSHWLLTMYHAPIYPAIKGRNGVVGAWENLFSAYQVDLAMEADGHCIKVTKPMRNGKEHPDGTIYIGEGGLGVRSRGPKDRPYIDKRGRGSHVFLIKVTKEELHLQVIRTDGSAWTVKNEDGSVWNSFTIKPKSHKKHDFK